MIDLVIYPLGRGVYRVVCDGRLILKASRQPLLDGARVFLAEGIPPETRIAMRHEGSPHVALSSSIGAAAKLTVEEDNNTVFRKWRGGELPVAASPSDFEDGAVS